MLALVCCASAPTPSAQLPVTPGAPTGVSRYALEVEAPRQGHRSSIPWIEVRGRLGTAELFESDVVLALDVSNSTLLASGIDLDEDGKVGKTRGFAKRRQHRGRAPRTWTTDADDTIAQAELVAAEAIVRGLSPRSNRIGILTYTGRSRVRAWLDDPAIARNALARLRLPEDWTGTSVAHVLREARDLLREAPRLGSLPRRRAVLLFTDGQPTVPHSEYLARRQAVYEAGRLGQEGIDLYIFSFGQLGPRVVRFLEEMVQEGGAALLQVDNPKTLLLDLAPVRLAPNWIEVENLTTGEDARALHASREGRFAGFLPLEPGPNEIAVRAELRDGREVRWREIVHYQPPEVVTEAHRREAAHLLIELRRRTKRLEAELEVDARE